MITPFDKYEALPAWDLFDNDMIRMAISAAKDEYDTAKKDLREFMDKYGDFYSPIQADMDWHNENVINRFLNTVNDLYAKGIDPLRTPEGRAAIQNAINSVDIGRIARNKVSAQNAEKYLENMARLDAAGKYDKSLEKDYLGYDLSNFDSSKGVWDRLSPTEAMSLKQLTESSFNNRTPHILTEQDVRDFGMEYDPRAQYTGFTYNDLLNIANTAAPGLTGTVHADYFRHLAEQKLKLYGIKNPTKQLIDSQLAQDIANSQIEYMAHPEADYNDYYKRLSLALQREQNRLIRQRNNAPKVTDDLPDNLLDGFSLYQRWWDKAQSNAWSKDGVHKDWMNMRNSYGQFGKEVDKVFHDFGVKLSSLNKVNLNDAIKNYQKEFSIPMDEVSVAKIVGAPLSDNNRVSKITDATIDKLFSTYDVVSNTSGFTRTHKTGDTKRIRDAIEKAGSQNVTLTPMGDGYGSLRKNSGSFEIMPRVIVTIAGKDSEGNDKIYKYEAYYDMGLKSRPTHNGSYLSGYKEIGGTTQTGDLLPRSDFWSGTFGIQDPIKYTVNPSYSTREYNMYPDYDQWVSYGPSDIRVSSDLKASPSLKLGGY